MNSVELLLILVEVWKYGSKNLRRNSVPKEFRSHPRGAYWEKYIRRFGSKIKFSARNSLTKILLQDYIKYKDKTDEKMFAVLLLFLYAALNLTT